MKKLTPVHIILISFALLVAAAIICICLQVQSQQAAAQKAEQEDVAAVDPDDITAAENGWQVGFFYLQVNSEYSKKVVGGNTLAASGCGIYSLCNAVYQLNKYKLDPLEVAEWANRAGLFNTATNEGTYFSMFQEAGWCYPDAHFSATGKIEEGIESQALRDHLMNGGTAVLSVYDHYIAVTDYNASNDTFLVIDSCPGDATGYRNNRTGITHTGGDWLSPDDFEDAMEVNGIILISAI